MGEGGGGSDGSRYLIRGDGEKRPILDQELARGANYTELLRTNPGEAGRPRAGGEVNWFLWGGVLSLLIALGAAAVQRQR